MAVEMLWQQLGLSNGQPIIPSSVQSSFESSSNMDQHFEDLFMIVKQRSCFFLFKKNFLTKSLSLEILNGNSFSFSLYLISKIFSFDPSF